MSIYSFFLPLSPIFTQPNVVVLLACISPKVLKSPIYFPRMDFEQELRRAAESILSIPKGAKVRIISHCDADGIASAAIAALALYRNGYGFHISIKKTGPNLMEDIKEEENDLFLFCDIGSSHLDKMNDLKGKVILCDHHVMNGDIPPNVINLNVRSYGIDGSKEASASSVVFLLANEMDEKNADLSQLALCGIIGDKQEKNGFQGINKKIIEMAEKKGFINLKEETIFSEKQEIMDILEKSIEPYFTAFSGGGAIRFLQRIGITPLKKLKELDEEERKKLFSALTVKLLEQGVDEIKWKKKKIYGNTYGDLYDMTSKLNACARRDEASIGVSLCLRDEKARDRAMELQEIYREEIRYELRALEKEGGKEMSSFRYFHTKKPSLTGTLAGLALSYLPNFPQDKPVIGISIVNGKAEISARGTESLVENGIDLSNALEKASRTVGGEGGGHPIAAGASIPAEKEKEFLEELDRWLK